MTANHHSQQIVQKLWNYCNVLRDDGLSYGDYVEQLTYLLFLKMAHEQTQPPWSRPSAIPAGYDWPSLLARDGDALEAHYRQRSDLDEFVACYRPDNRHQRQPTWSADHPTGRWRAYPYEELLQRDKVSLDLFWLRDESLEDAAGLADPDLIAAEIVEDLRAALEEFEAIQTDLAPI